MSLYRLTASLLNSWLRATDPEANGTEYSDFLADLAREKRATSPAAQQGIDFEDMVYKASQGAYDKEAEPEKELAAAIAFGHRMHGGSYQVKAMKQMEIGGTPLNLVGIADFVKAGIITDIKRVQRYEYGKYQGSAQHPMYMELWPEAIRFDYLIWDGRFAYSETYRRGDFEPIQGTVKRFLDYLDGAGLTYTYFSHWKEKE